MIFYLCDECGKRFANETALTEYFDGSYCKRCYNKFLKEDLEACGASAEEIDNIDE